MLIQKIRHTYFFYLFLFTLVFGVILYEVTGFKSMDEAASVILLVFYILFACIERKRIAVEIPVIVCIFLFYLCHSFYLSYNSRSAIALDFLVQIRPYLTFFMVLQLAPSFSPSQKKLLKRICLCIWPFFIPIGLYGLVSPSFIKTVMEQESKYVSGIVCLSLVYLYCSHFTVKELFIFIFMLTTGMLAVHAKFYGFYFLTIGILICFQDARILKSGWRTGFAVLIVFAVLAYISKSQIASYLFPPEAGNSHSDFMARSILYRSGVDILKDFMPFGSGFASYATELSGKYYSQIYAAYGLNSVDGFSPQNWLSVSGSYYPSLVQFGVAGILLYLLFWTHTAGKTLLRFKREGDIRWFVIALTIISFIFIENLSDTFFSSNKGFFMMMFLGLLAGKYGKSADLAVVNAGEEPVATGKYGFVEGAIMPPETPDVFLKIPDIPPVEEDIPDNGREIGIREETELIVIANEPEYEEEDEDEDEDEEEDDDDYDDEYDDEEEEEEEEESGDGETDASPSDRAIEELVPETPGMPQDEAAVIPEEIELSKDKDNEPVKIEEGDMISSELEDKIEEIPLKDEDVNDDFPIFEPLLDEADAELAPEATENKGIREHSTPERQNEDDLREKPAAEDKETNEDDAPIDYII
jgi:hypothetical protein